MSQQAIWYTGLPVVTVDPPSQSVEVTDTVKFTSKVSGIGKENFSYQWKRGAKDIDGETSSTLTIDSVTEDHSDTYKCVVRNEYENYDEFSAKLIVTSKSYQYKVAQCVVCPDVS